MKEFLSMSVIEISSMTNEVLHQKFLQIRSEINRLTRLSERSIELEIVYCYFVKEIQTRE